MTQRLITGGAINVDGAVLRYRCEGSGLPALVIGSAIYYPRVFSRQLRKSLRLIFMDVRHFAEVDNSLDPDRLSLDTYLDDIERVRAHLGLDRVVLIGHSHHGNLALEYAKRRPERVTHIVLIGSPPVDVHAIRKAAQLYWEVHASDERKTTLRQRQAEITDQTTREQAYVARYVADGPRYWYDASHDALALWQGVPLDMDIIEVFRDFFADGYELQWNPGQLAAPILVVMGEYDYAVPHTLWTEARKAQANLTFHLFERSGHTPPLEEPEDFDRVLIDWLKANSPEAI
ncbi:alpha/beta hydrolase [Natronospirillum operosum]|uniref:Alpha/beta hydrolase n=1 Tax=Natronospirillum operosum TaxID=2759953 RepID=A0A4Z0W3N1_9GAMM|nr:alpha/beta hydrolase [Natronospirillum operosum]TGG91738.1 alpha/beta hydrolase [Natronospirillum operosum]